MCGIAAVLGDVALANDDLERLRRRGPDYFRKKSRTFPNRAAACSDASQKKRRVDGPSNAAVFYASVLRMRVRAADSSGPQPAAVGKDGSLLLFNGEVYAYDGTLLAPGEPDVAVLCREMERLPASLKTAASKLAHVAQRIQGPFSAIYYDASTGTIAYGRDLRGRRSLLEWRCNSAGKRTVKMLSSCSLGDGSFECIEVESGAIFSCSLRGDASEFPIQLNTNLVCQMSIAPLPRVQAAGKFLAALAKAVKMRVMGAPPPLWGDCRVAVLYSGGVDCTAIAALCHRYLPLDEPIDLLNVCFSRCLNAKTYKPSPDRLAAESGVEDLARACKGRTFRLVRVDVQSGDFPPAPDSSTGKRIHACLSPLDTHMDFNLGSALWYAAMGKGIATKHTLRVSEHDAPLACSITSADPLRGTNAPSLRYSGSAASKAECEAIVAYIPQATFDAPLERSFVKVKPENGGNTYHCGARVCLSGAGADELLLGYGRHRSSYTRRTAKEGMNHEAGMRAASEESLADMKRWPRRNGGRDDRCVADHSRELRLPFLDENVEALVMDCGGAGAFADFRQPQGSGDKRALRDAVAALGLNRAPQLVKRALQFGTRAAQASNKAFYGSNSKANKKNCGSAKCDALVSK